MGGRRPALLAIVAVLGLAPAAEAQTAGLDADPAYRPSGQALAASLDCPRGTPNGRPVLLVHGTGSTPSESWARGYVKTLPAIGLDPCTVAMPGRTLGDAQLSAEYVAFGIQRLAARVDRRIGVIGWSQGTINARWALTFWPSTRPLVEDYVSFAGTHHGTVDADGLCAAGSCNPSVWQQRRGSAHTTALNRRFETPPGVPSTSIFSETDEIVQPQSDGSSGTSFLSGGAANFLVQRVCPGPVSHAEALGDNGYYAVTADALLQAGAAQASRLAADRCARPFAPGITDSDFASFNTDTLPRAGAAVFAGPKVAAEPAVECYAQAQPSCPASRAVLHGALELSVAPAKATAGRTRSFALSVALRSDAGAQLPARGATVRLGSQSATTDADGRATVVETFDQAGEKTARASLAGYRSDDATVAVSRQRRGSDDRADEDVERTRSGVSGEADADPGMASSPAAGSTELPFTGFHLAPLLLVGSFLLAAGLTLRGLSRRYGQ